MVREVCFRERLFLNEDHFQIPHSLINGIKSMHNVRNRNLSSCYVNIIKTIALLYYNYTESENSFQFSYLILCQLQTPQYIFEYRKFI